MGPMCNQGMIVWGVLFDDKQLNDPFLFYYAYFVVSFNHFERLGFVIFMYRMFIINERVACHKSAMPFDYPPHVANSSWLSD